MLERVFSQSPQQKCEWKNPASRSTLSYAQSHPKASDYITSICFKKLYKQMLSELVCLKPPKGAHPFPQTPQVQGKLKNKEQRYIKQTAGLYSMGGFKWIPSRLIYLHCRAAKAEMTIRKVYFLICFCRCCRGLRYTVTSAFLVYFHHGLFKHTIGDQEWQITEST